MLANSVFLHNPTAQNSDNFSGAGWMGFWWMGPCPGRMLQRMGYNVTNDNHF